MANIDKTLAATSAAVTGPDTPEAIQTSQRQDDRLIWGLLCAAAVAALLTAGVVSVLTFMAWPANVAAERIKYLGLGLLGLIGIFGILGFSMTRGKRVEAKAGPASVVVDA